MEGEISLDDERVKRIVKKLSEDVSLIKNFKDIKVINKKGFPVATSDIKNNELWINIGNEDISFSKLLDCLAGVISHECGHTDERLHSPASKERAKKHMEKVENKNLLNIIYDLEIHYQYLEKKRLEYSKRKKLSKFLTIMRNNLFERNKESIILSIEYPKTPLQKKVKEIIGNRNLNIVEKCKKIKELLPEGRGKRGRKGNKEGEKEEKLKPITKIKFPKEEEKEEGKGKRGKGKKREEKGKGEDEEVKKKVSIKDKIKDKHKQREIKKKLKALGFSGRECEYLAKKYYVDKLDKIVDNIEKSFDNILPSLNTKNGKEKTKERIDKRGHRINGYRRIRDYSEVVKNPEDFLTIGEYDLNEVRIPMKIRRKTDSSIILLRDVSGSVSSPPLNRIVRDITVSLIILAKKKGNKIGVIDFHSYPEPIEDRNGNILTDDYNILLAESMLFKSGYSTKLSKALEKVNELLEENEMEDKNLNLFMVSDSYVDDCSGVELKGREKNVVGFWADTGNTYYSSGVDDKYRRFIKRYNGKIFKVEKVKDKLISKIYETFY